MFNIQLMRRDRALLGCWAAIRLFRFNYTHAANKPVWVRLRYRELISSSEEG